MSKRMLADVLWEAANKHLESELFSCHAVARTVCGPSWQFKEWEATPSQRFLRSIGCPAFASNVPAWHWTYSDDLEDWQHTITGVRYMWLLLAMHVAEDERITV